VVEKVIKYGFALEYFEFTLLLLLIYIKIFLDVYYYDNDERKVDYYIEYKGTPIYEYKEIIEISKTLQ
jgi:hypothetical protein